MSFSFKTKAQTLKALVGQLRHSKLCEQIVFNVDRWQDEVGVLPARIIDAFAPSLLAVRSSNRAEDTAHTSNAGTFKSVTNVSPTPEEIARAVQSVAESYGYQAGDQEILVQPMVANVSLSGVVMTRDLNTGAPYYVINYDDYSGRTDTVTRGGISNTVAVHRANPAALTSPRMIAVLSSVQELESVTGSSELDIEFCMNTDNQVYVLQVRPMATKRQWNTPSDVTITNAIAKIRSALDDRMAPSDGLAGTRTILGEMPDWNPAEMIGNTPRPLALSLYKELITDQVWSDARAAMGYRHVPHPLLVEYAGRPYIDVRLSLNSFLPKGVDHAFAHGLIDHQLSILANDKSLHDKIEFDVSITCADLALDDRLASLKSAGFANVAVDQFGDQIRALTADAIRIGPEGLRACLSRTTCFLDHPKTDNRRPLERAFDLLELVKHDGTPPFSILARHGFIGVLMLRSAVRQGIIEEGDAEKFMQTIRTVATSVVNDMGKVSTGTISRDHFLRNFGHLRPGTYDILSPRYDETPDLYLGSAGFTRETTLSSGQPFTLSATQKVAFSKALASQGLPSDVDAVLAYITAAIQAREAAKFAFTRGVSNALSAIQTWSNKIGLSPDSISYLSLAEIKAHEADTKVLREMIAAGRDAHALTRSIRLPHLIVEPDDIDIVRAVIGQPTYVTTGSVTARRVFLDHNRGSELNGQIVLIESADPGFDWIFSHDIAGLITKFGGVNSHMAIRCAEFNLPAAIGCGEKLFEQLWAAPVLELNCSARTVRGIRP